MIRATLLVIFGIILLAMCESKDRVKRDLVEHEIRARDQASGLWRRVVDGPERR